MAVAALNWVVMGGVRYLPQFYSDNVILQTGLGNQVNLALCSLAILALLVLFARRRSVLDLWLMVSLAGLDTELPGSRSREFGALLAGLVRGARLCPGRELHVAERVADKMTFLYCALPVR